MTLPPRPVFVHLLQSGAGGQEGPVKVDREQALPILKLELVQRLDRLDTGVADQDIDAAQTLGDLRHAGVDLRLVGHIHLDADGDRLVTEDAGGGDRLVEVEVGDRDFRAGFHKRFRRSCCRYHWRRR